MNYPTHETGSVRGYYFHQLHSYWFSHAPSAEQARQVEFVSKYVANEDRYGIKLAIRRDGLIKFDFTNWGPGSGVIIPGFTGNTVTTEHREASDLAVLHMYARNKVMHCHIAAINTAIATIQSTSVHPFLLVKPDEHFRFPNFSDDLIHGNLRTQLYKSHYQLAADLGEMGKSRELVPDDVIALANNLFYSIVSNDQDDYITLVDLLYKSAHYYSRHDFAECHVISWSVCEKLIDGIWKRYLMSRKAELSLTGDLWESLAKGHDYTASIRTRVLNLVGKIDVETRDKLDRARSARNAWVHKLKVDVSSDDAANCFQIAAKLLHITSGIDLRLSLGYSHAY